jgi:uroporphyrinogen-III synthase
LVTAARNYAAPFAEQVLKKDGLPVLMPAVETFYLEDYGDLDYVLHNFSEFDGILFTSRNGIEGFFQRFAESLLSICGRVDLIPQEPSPVGII